jgi:hypothetical protein
MAAASSSVADHQRFFKFIFLARSWASDRANLTKALKNLSANAKGTNTIPGSSKDGEDSSLLDKTTSKKSSGRSPLWLFIFPEGTITSDDERVKSKRYADKEGIVRFPTLYFTSQCLYIPHPIGPNPIRVSRMPFLPCVTASH